LLGWTPPSIKNIAFQSGFSRFRHMSVVFRQELKMPPTNFIQCCLLIGMAMAPPSSVQAQPLPLRVFIFAGQSNMVGTHSRVASIQRFPPFAGLDKPQANVLFSYKLGREQMATSDGWIALQPTGDDFGRGLESRQSGRL